MVKINYLKLGISIILPQLAALIGSLFTITTVGSWYLDLKKPFFNPPNWIFGPVWTILYILMGFSLYLVWVKGINNPQSKIALSLFFVQLILNVLWSILFFGLNSPFAAFIDIVFLVVSILLTIISFYSISKPAAYLLIPYVLWVGFASVLNFFIYYLNK